MYVNMCLYLSKGVADYLAIWDIDEYFIPKFPHNSIMDVINAAENPNRLNPVYSKDIDTDQLLAYYSGNMGATEFSLSTDGITWATASGLNQNYQSQSQSTHYRGGAYGESMRRKESHIVDRH